MPQISIDQLVAAVSRILRDYADKAAVDVDRVTHDAVVSLVQQTRASAPRGDGKRTLRLNAYGDGQARPHFFTSIAQRKQADGSYLWHVKKPNLRLTHLLAKSHASRSGGTVSGDPFLVNPLAAVLTQYEADLRKVLSE